MEKSDVVIDNTSNKDPRWQVVLGYKGKKYRMLDAFRKLEKVLKLNSSDTENPVQYANRNMSIKEEMDRLSIEIDYCKEKMNEMILKIHSERHK